MLFRSKQNETNFDYNLLNKSYCYGFVICHPENRIVSSYNNDCFLVHVITRDMNTLQE